MNSCTCSKPNGYHSTDCGKFDAEERATQVSAAFITPECRAGRGDDGAWDEAVERLHALYEQVVEGWKDEPEQPTLNLILTMERPK